MKTIQPEALQANVFDLIGNRWMLLTAGNSEMANTMTASWGSMGRSLEPSLRLHLYPAAAIHQDLHRRCQSCFSELF